MKPKKQFSPSNLRTLLGVGLSIVVIGGGALFYYGLTIVREYSTTVSQSAVDAEASAQQISSLQLLKAELAQNTSLVDKANQIFSTPDAYQVQVLDDIRRYADAAGLGIANTSFSDPNTGAGNAITVTFRQPVSYSGLINFLNNVEGNLPKLQVSSIALGYDDGAGADGVEVGEIKINIAVR